jgi:hypothetical protein
MRIFQHSQGYLVAFGFDMVSRKPMPRRICWSDPSGDWDMRTDNHAGWCDLSFTVNPEFIRENAGRIVAYQPGKCVEMTLVDGPFIWNFTTLQSDTTLAAVA